MALRAALVVLAVLVPSVSPGAKIPVGEQSSLNVGVLLQSHGAVSGSGAPNGGLGTDFYLRRIRLLVHGTVTPRLSFFVDVDQPNMGKDGDWSPAFFIQDAFLSYAAVEKLLFVDAGMMLAPLSHQGLQGAGSLHTLDYHSGLVRYPSGKIWRDAGVQLRSYLVDGKLHLRGGVFNGVEGRAASADGSVPPLNLGDAPRFAAHARWNFLGKEESFFFGGIYFAKEPVLSVGLGGDVQPGGATSDGLYSAFAADVFGDLPFGADQELVFQAHLVRFDRGATSTDSGLGGFFEVGYRFGLIEPLVSVEYFDSAVARSDLLAFRPGVNLWVDKHTFNVKLEVGLTRQGNLREAPLGVSAAAQAQLAF